MPQVSNSLCRRAQDIAGRINGRKGVNPDTVTFKELEPLILKNHVSNTKMRQSNSTCVKDMQTMLTCLQKFDMNQAMCSKEIKRFQDCNAKARAELMRKKATANKNGIPVDKPLVGTQMNAYLKKFPLSTKTQN